MQAPRFQQGRKTTLRAELWLLIAAASLGVGACSQPVEGGETQDHVGRTIQPIVGGTTSGADQDAVVVLARFDNGVRVGLCTATLIAPNLAVTARHCVSQSDPSAACGADGQPVVGALLHGDRAPATLAVFEAPGGAAPDTTTDVGASARGKALVVDPATTFCNQDIAYIVLDRSLKGSIAPVRLAPPETSDVLTAVGFGITEAGGLPASRMQRRDLTLVGAGPMPLPDDARYGAGDAEFVVGESACAGDSGSPALAASGAVVGIASRAGNGQPRDPNNAASTCLGDSAHAVYAQFGAKQALALRAFAEAGAKPWLEGEPDPRIAPKSGPSGSKPGTPSGATAGESDSAPVAAPASSVEEGEVEPSASGGCSASSEPTHDAVEHALGVVAILLLALRLRRAGRRREDVPAGASSEKRIPYVDLGMRESFVSLPDDR